VVQVVQQVLQLQQDHSLRVSQVLLEVQGEIR
jgi:hypothetical protein